MPRTRPPYPAEFREQMVALVRTGRSPEKLAQEFEPSSHTIRNWVKQADLDEGRRTDGVTTEEREEARFRTEARERHAQVAAEEGADEQQMEVQRGLAPKHRDGLRTAGAVEHLHPGMGPGEAGR